METPFIPLESKSSVSMVSDEHHDETLKHGKYHKWKVIILGIVLFIAIIGYAVYGINKYKESKSNPQTKTTVNSVAEYEIPLIWVCPDETKYGTIYPYYFLYGNFHINDNTVSYNYLCFPSSSGYLIQNDYVPSYPAYENYEGEKGGRAQHSCEELMGNEYDKDRKAWTLINYTSSVTFESVKCWALIPPKNSQFSNRIYWPFVWIPSDISLQYLQNKNVDIDYITSYQLHFGVDYNIVHPDYIDDWYQTTVKSAEDINYQVGQSTSGSFPVSLWEASTIVMSFFSKTSLSKKVYSYYETHFKGRVRSRSNLEYVNKDDIVIPQFSIIIETHTVNGNGDSDGILFHSDTKEYQDYTATDFFSGIGGIISLTLQGFGVIAGILLIADFVGFTGWKGFAPYPPFEQQDQVRLRRFMNKEMKEV